MKRNINVSQLVPKQNVHESFVVKHITSQESRDGKKYLNLSLSDSSGEIEGRAWNNIEDMLKEVKAGDFAKIKGKVNLFQGRRQLIVSEVQKLAKSEVNVEDFIIKSEFSPEVMFEELLGIVKNLNDVYIKSLLEKVITDQEIKRRLLTWQAGKTIHHAYKSGLLEHILSCSKLAFNLSEFYKLNVNFVVAGAILHDICKIYELTDNINVEYTEEGKLVGHLVKGVELLDRFAYKVNGFPYNTKLHLKHILLSHHGHHEYGSPKLPQTREALLLHHIDLIDSKMGSFNQVIKSDPNTGHWSNYVRHLDRIVYKKELPTYESFDEVTHKADTKTEKNKKTKVDKELKESLSNLLEGFNVKK